MSNGGWCLNDTLIYSNAYMVSGWVQFVQQEIKQAQVHWYQLVMGKQSIPTDPGSTQIHQEQPRQEGEHNSQANT